MLFGTDVGYMHDYDTAEEYELMAQAGMDAGQILASLTTAPAERFGDSDMRGGLHRVSQRIWSFWTKILPKMCEHLLRYATRCETGKSSTRPTSHTIHPDNEQPLSLHERNAVRTEKPGTSARFVCKR